ncbi:MAG: rhomboid family intramembrane serine protease [Spirochaetota bacterium]
MFIPFHDEIKNRNIPYATIITIIINIVIFLLLLTLSKENLIQVYKIFGTIPYELINFKSAENIINFNREFPFFLTLITSSFIHGSPMHLIGNMLFLWIFGKRIEDDLGIILFIVFFISLGIASSYINAFTGYFELLPHYIVSSEFTPTIGASGVIAGLMGAYLLKHPKAVIDILFIFFIIRIRAYWFLVIWIFTQILSILPMGGETANNTAWFSHIGGFFFGLLLIYIIDRSRRNINKNNSQEQTENNAEKENDDDDNDNDND